MKKLQIIAWSIVVIGLLFRLFHYPGTAIVSILGTLLLVIHAVIYLVKQNKTNLPGALVHLSIALMTVYFLFRLQYWSCGPDIFGFSMLFILAFLLAVSSFVLLFRSKTTFTFIQLFFAGYFVLFFVLSFTRSYKLYYFFNLNTILNAESRKSNFKVWDKYSWFLYLAERKEEAMDANRKAQAALDEFWKESSDDDAEQYFILIEQHRRKIRDGNWTSFP